MIPKKAIRDRMSKQAFFFTIFDGGVQKVAYRRGNSQGRFYKGLRCFWGAF